jgi:hypothetical protein
LTRKKQSLAANLLDDSAVQTLPRPTQTAFKPMKSGSEIWQGIGLGFLCLLGAAVGLGAWFDPTVLDRQTAMTTASNNTWLIIFLPFIFPIFLPIAFYLWWDTWRRWRKTRFFERGKQTTSGVITHLWLDPPRPPGKRYYVGYQFGEGKMAYQEVRVRTYNNLTVGDEVTVEYVQTDPSLSRLDLQKRRQKRAVG